MQFEEALALGELIAKGIGTNWDASQAHIFALGIAYANGLTDEDILYHATGREFRNDAYELEPVDAGGFSPESQLAELLDRMTFRQPDPYAWEVSIEGLGTGLPLNVTTWAGKAMISRETYGAEAEAQARAATLRARIYEARSAYSGRMSQA